LKEYRLLSTIFIGGLMLFNCSSRKLATTPEDLYKSQEAKRVAFKSYDRIMEFWPVDYDEVWVETDYGVSHVIVSGPEGAKPVFLFPGLFADATMWFANVGPLATQYRVYCLDQITYGGKSKPAGKMVVNIDDYIVWFNQHMEKFGYDQVAVGGLSYGGWLSLALARQSPSSISAVIMLDPSESFAKMDGGIAWRGFRDFMWFPNRDKYRRFFDWMGGTYSTPKSDLWLEHLLDVIEYGSVGMFDVPQHRVYSRAELKNVSMPVLIMAGGKPIVYKDPEVFAEAAAKALPHAQIEIVPETGHSLNVEKADTVNTIIVDFLLANYPN
jgi:pimeloyl-ACP methyl ester carboxylesterase